MRLQSKCTGRSPRKCRCHGEISCIISPEEIWKDLKKISNKPLIDAYQCHFDFDTIISEGRYASKEVDGLRTLRRLRDWFIKVPLEMEP